MATPSVVRKIPLSKEKDFEHGDNGGSRGINSCRFSCSSWCAVCESQMQTEYRRRAASEEGRGEAEGEEGGTAACDPSRISLATDWLTSCATDVQAIYLREVELLRGKLLELRENLPLCLDSAPGGGEARKPAKPRDQKRLRTPPEPKRVRQLDDADRPPANALAGLKRPRDGSPHNHQESTFKFDAPQKASPPVLKEMGSALSLESEADEDDCEEDVEDTEEDADFGDDGTDDVARSIHHSLKMNPATVEMEKEDMLEPDRPENLHPCLRPSLFRSVPPYVKFTMYNTKEKDFPLPVQEVMKWRLTTITPVVVRKTVANSGFKLVRKAPEWSGTWGKHMQSVCFRTLSENQKLNHFPGTFQIGRKDSLWKNLYRFMNKYGKKEFGFIPRTYILPQDVRLLRTAWEKHGSKGKWIIKPPASARGSGIKVVHKWCQIPRKVPLIVQKYISNPYLINGSKFDLRLYVLVTSFNPLVIHLYEDGLVRFASVKYSDDMNTLADRYMHLTNYSINKLSTQYTHNEDAKAPQGHKWTIKTLWSYLVAYSKVDVDELWANLKELVIKTMIGGESAISRLTWNNLPSRYCSYELFGVDVLLDENLKPWLLEVNISPSLHSSSPLDLAVKGPMVKDLLNIVGFHIPNKFKRHEEELKMKLGVEEEYSFDYRLYTVGLSQVERRKQGYFSEMEDRNMYLDSILDELTPDDVRHLIHYEDELTQLGGFQKIFPTSRTYRYQKFFESSRYYNMLFDAWESKYHNNRRAGVDLLDTLCQQGVHLDVSQVEKRKSQVSLNEVVVVTEESEADSVKSRSCSTINNDDGTQINKTITI